MLKVISDMLKPFMLVVFTTFCFFLLTSPASATENVSYNVSVATVLNLTIPTTPIVLNLDPYSKPFDSKDITVGVGTNNKTGYTLTLSTPNDDTFLARDNSTETISAQLNTLDPGTYSQSDFTANRWGYKINSNTSIPSTITSGYVPFVSGNTLMESSTAVNHHEAELTFAAKIDYLQAYGSYSTTFNFNLVANPLIYYIQDIDYTICTTNPMTVIDRRDNQEYIIQKLADGRCWMLDNLRLDPTEVDLAALRGNTNATDEILTYFKEGGGSGAYPATGVSGSSWTNSYDVPYINADSKDTIDSDASKNWGNGSHKYGVYYNFCAASAGSYCYGYGLGIDDAQYDICPAGWRLPTGGESGEYQVLADIYTATDAADANSIQANLSTPLSGRFYAGSADNQGGFGNFWASTYSDDDEKKGIYVNILYGSKTIIQPQYRDTRNTGRSVRCVLKETRTLSDIANMQDINLDIIANTATGASKVLKDNRDDEEYLVKKLNDGNIWLLENLRLDLTDTNVKANLTSATTNATNTVLGYLKDGGGSGAYPATGVSSSWANSYNVPYINAESKNTTQAASGSSPAGKIGVFYNYCAATAGSYCYSSYTGRSNAQYDICPFGWKMPNGDTALGSYYYLYNTTYGASVANFQSALSTPLSGYYYNSAKSDQGTSGRFWSATYSTTSAMYRLGTDSSTVTPQATQNRNYGLPVRCVTKTT